MVIPIITMSSTYKMRIVVLRLQCMTHIAWSPLLSLYPNLPNALLNLSNHVQKYNLRPYSKWMHFCYRIKCLLIVYSILLSKILRNHSCFEPFNAKNPFTPLSTSLSNTKSGELMQRIAKKKLGLSGPMITELIVEKSWEKSLIFLLILNNIFHLIK